MQHSIRVEIIRCSIRVISGHHAGKKTLIVLEKTSNNSVRSFLLTQKKLLGFCDPEKDN
jgi:hypothetical protein